MLSGHPQGLIVIAAAITLVALLYKRIGAAVKQASDDAGLELPSQVGAYTLVERLGRGGMGEVWRAEHRTLKRPAAIKLIRPELTRRLGDSEREALRKQFEREIQATARLTSPHTVTVYDFGTTDDGRLYYAMELLRGLDLETVVDRFGPLPADRVICLLQQICESLSEAHAAGLLHRDIKPANLHLCSIGRGVDFVKVFDFGLVHDAAGSGPFRGAGFAGTPAYFPPETAAGNEIDARSDIYSLGCVAYYMLTGQLVFDAKTVPEMIAAHLSDRVVPPSLRTELDIPAELEALVLACLAKDPDARPQSMDELRCALARVSVSSVWDQSRASAWWRLHVPGSMLAAECR